MPAKAKRLQIFLRQLKAAPPASSADDAFKLLAGILNAVEDEFSGISYRPENWRNDGRMYPPQEDSRVKSLEYPSLRNIATKGITALLGLMARSALKLWREKFLSINRAQMGERPTSRIFKLVE
ncbi:MAG TPA: hypothetical protein VH413_12485 [Verrucomicrobiae bacterium]|jgi:hypothetical protein|nr:hypothetical protein [Verrucomicrobiae bacterium]